MTLISLEDAKTEVRKAVSDFKTRYDINYRLNNLPSIEIEEEAEQTEPQTEDDKKHCAFCKWFDEPNVCGRCRNMNLFADAIEDEPQTELIAQIHELYADMEKLLRKSSAEIVGAIREQGNQRKGEWKETGRMTQHGQYYYFRYCTKCFYARDDCDSEKDTNFCPNCGADMRGEE